MNTSNVKPAHGLVVGLVVGGLVGYYFGKKKR